MSQNRPTKAEVRASLRAIEPPADRAQAEAAIVESLREVCSEDEKGVLAYLWLGDEPRIDDLMQWLLSRGRCVCVPMVDWSAGEMAPGRVGNLDSLVTGRYGVREPEGGSEVVPILEIGTVLVPGVGFDRDGYRLGRGGGFYDRFLSRLGPEVRRVGVVFENRVVACVPRDPWDEKVERIVTERGVAVVRGALER
ncbi:MAG: 5-formyltetrahydrofolate cyclo-ligase [Phycisphaeraceae bacterium]|nr:5-formyltetrahydrofolate cyclo-ligase [Phycisphaeraceae bacterium]MCW5762057.1 5-formyltetrahydrofolate cyclo-ligase [Phycisphaeraceae bacterium]